MAVPATANTATRTTANTARGGPLLRAGGGGAGARPTGAPQAVQKPDPGGSEAPQLVQHAWPPYITLPGVSVKTIVTAIGRTT